MRAPKFLIAHLEDTVRSGKRMAIKLAKTIPALTVKNGVVTKKNPK